MIKSLSLKNFTAFGQVSLEFSSGLNVIVGENGTGKTHLLKLGYLFSTIWGAQVKNRNKISKEDIERYVSERLLNIFKPNKIGGLTRSESDGKSEVSCVVAGTIPTVSITVQGENTLPPVADEIKWEFQFSDRSEKKALIDKLPERLTSNASYNRSVYLPSKEMVSFFDGFISLYETHELQFDETYRDLALKLSSPNLKKRPESIGVLLAKLSVAIGGEITLEGGRFYVVSEENNRRREITLLAEGLRKIATIMRLIENGSLQPGDTLFWDEPEANLNPHLIKLVAEALLHLCNIGIQVSIATHSLFLLRELEILSGRKEFSHIKHHYFALKPTANGVSLSQGDSVDDVDPLIMLDESLQQSDRFIAMEETT